MEKNCDHEWEYIEHWRLKLTFDGETIQIPQKCLKCGLEGWEVWTYSCVVDKNKTKEIN